MHAYNGIIPRPFRESDNDNWKYYEYVRIATNQPYTNPNPNVQGGSKT